MKPIAFFLAGALLLLGLVLPSRSQWGTRACASVEAPRAVYEWRTRQDDPDRVYLFKNGLHVGAYDGVQDYYRPYDAKTDTWGECCPSPIEAPKRMQHFFGVETSKLSGEERYTLHTAKGSQCISKESAKEIMAKGLEDDSSKLRVTVIGPEDQRKKVMCDLAQSPEVKQWAIVRDYPPNHWAVQPGFVTTGSPTIYCQAPTGKVLHRQDDYQGGVGGLTGALRKAKEHYDQAKDRDLRKGFSFPNIDFAKYGLYLVALILGVGAGLFLIHRKAVN